MLIAWPSLSIVLFMILVSRRITLKSERRLMHYVWRMRNGIESHCSVTFLDLEWAVLYSCLCNDPWQKISMQIRPSRHFLLQKHHPYTTHCLLLRHSILHGQYVLVRWSMLHLKRPWVLQLQNSMNTIRKQLIPMLTYLPWVCLHLFFIIYHLNCYLVLHPEKKMSHFKKYWKADVQKEVEDLLKTKVCHWFSDQVCRTYSFSVSRALYSAAFIKHVSYSCCSNSLEEEEGCLSSRITPWQPANWLRGWGWHSEHTRCI